MSQCEEWITDIQQYSSDKRVGRTMSHHAAALKVISFSLLNRKECTAFQMIKIQLFVQRLIGFCSQIFNHFFTPAAETSPNRQVAYKNMLTQQCYLESFSQEFLSPVSY